MTESGYEATYDAARVLLRDTKLGRRLSLSTAQDVIADTVLAGIADAYDVRTPPSPASLADKSRVAIRAIELPTKKHVLPVTFAPTASDTDITFGNTRFLSKARFDANWRKGIENQKESGSDHEREGARRWLRTAAKHDHFFVVEVPNHEDDLGRAAARRSATLLLNLIRFCLDRRAACRSRITTERFESRDGSSLAIATDGTFEHVLRYRWPGTSLETGWQTIFEEELAIHRDLLTSLSDWFISGADGDDPILQRIEYASHLLDETYSEPHARIALLRFTSALEALAAFQKGLA